MRRLLFNPLAQKPYASGEYNNTNVNFVLDKSLEDEHLYYGHIVGKTYGYQSCFLLDTHKKYETVLFYTTPFVFVASDGTLKSFTAWLEDNKLTIETDGTTGVSNEDNYIIYIYRLM